MMVTLLWSMWYELNSVVFGRRGKGPTAVFAFVSAFHASYLKARQRWGGAVDNTEQGADRWMQTPTRWVKINTDVAMGNGMGMGASLRIIWGMYSVALQNPLMLLYWWISARQWRHGEGSRRRFRWGKGG